jgi:dUTP pyrophosphatase
VSAFAVNKESLEGELKVGLQRLSHGLDLPLPSYGTRLSAGLDLYAAVEEDVVLAPFERKAIPTGIAIALPPGYEGQIRSRSGLALKQGVVILNSPGTIDADYRGELLGILINQGQEPFTITRGMRFAQLVIAPVSRISWDERQALDETDRGLGRFGSTGIYPS